MAERRALTMLNQSGDTTITWDAAQDEEMERIILRKMAQGVSFFVIEPRMGGLMAPTLTKLEGIEQARKHRALSIPDTDLAAFVGEGKGDAVPTPAAPVKSTRRSKDAKEIARSESVGVRPLVGG